MNDLVSIIMPTYNSCQFIKQSIKSVLSQTYSNWELIIIDDCSNDNTYGIVKEFDDKRVCYFRNDTNLGTAKSRNRALKIAKGKWIAFLDSDDVWYPKKLERQINFMNSKGYDFSYTNYEEIDAYGNSLRKIVTGPRKITKKGMKKFCWPGCLTVMYNQQIVGCVQIPEIKVNNDYAMWLRVSEFLDCYLLEDNLAQYRRRKGSVSNHSYLELLKWHYKLFREVEKESVTISLFCTFRNILFGIYKKIRYVRDV